MKATKPEISRKRKQQWQEVDVHIKNPDPYKKSYKPHEISNKEQFYSEVSKKRPKPDPATVEAELQLEEQLWNQ
jgi:hypothetical protein